MSNELLNSPAHPAPQRPEHVPAPRVREPVRNQMSLVPTVLDDLIEANHPARAIWAVTEKLDLSEFFDAIKARESGVGRSAITPRLLVALWLFATSEGIGSARRLEKLTKRDAPYRWLCGEINVNHHTLSDFRVRHDSKLDNLFSNLLTVLLEKELVTLHRVAHDGTKIRASAGTRSFRRAKTLKERLELVKKHVEEVKDAGQKEESTTSAHRASAAKRHAEDFERRITAAIDKIPGLEAKRKEKKKDPEFARASTTDVDANIMKMPDKGYRPAYNAQFSTDVDSRVIVGVSVTTEGTDMGQLSPALDDIERRCGRLPDRMLVDGGYTKLDAITDAEARGVTILAPIKEQKKTDAHAPKRTDSKAVAEWRVRMADETIKKEYRLRAAVAETTNADLKTKRGLNSISVRGLRKVKCIVLWSAMAYNVLKLISATAGTA